jgi:hypothetical protein
LKVILEREREREREVFDQEMEIAEWFIESMHDGELIWTLHTRQEGNERTCGVVGSN